MGDDLTLGGPVYFIEPRVAGKRRRVVEKRFGQPDEDLELLRQRLFEFRKRSIKNINKNLKKFKGVMKENEHLTLNIVKEPSEAVKYILNENKDQGLSRVDINKSNTLRPLTNELIQNGFEIVDTYNFATASGNLGIFDNLEPGNYWTIRGLELDNALRSFDLNPKPMVYTRQLISKATGNKDFIGVIGANVFSATGEILAVQHLYNISSILAHAKKVFIILTLDKLVDNYSDALFQARCTAMYGLEQIILDLFDSERGKKKSKVPKPGKYHKGPQATRTLKDANYEQYKTPENLHIIILGDTRLDLVGSKYEELLYCINCRRCGLYCPRVRARSEERSMVPLNARELLMDGFLNGPEKAIADGLFDCTLCRACTKLCPVGIELTEHIQELRERCQRADLFSKPHKRIRNNILEVGNAYGSDHAIKPEIKK